MRAQLASEAKNRGSRLTLLMGGWAENGVLTRGSFQFRTGRGENQNPLKERLCGAFGPLSSKLFTKQITNKSKNDEKSFYNRLDDYSKSHLVARLIGSLFFSSIFLTNVNEWYTCEATNKVIPADKTAKQESSKEHVIGSYSHSHISTEIELRTIAIMLNARIQFSFFILIMYQYAQLLNCVYKQTKTEYLFVNTNNVCIFASET